MRRKTLTHIVAVLGAVWLAMIAGTQAAAQTAAQAFPSRPVRIKMSDGIEDKYKFIRHIERQEKIIIKPPYVAS